MENNIAIYSVVYPAALPFLDDLFKCLEKQTDKEFDVILVNDGIPELVEFISNYNLKFNILNVFGSFAKNREETLLYSKSKYENIIFLDSDDYCDENRVEVSKKLLLNHKIVVSNLTLVNSEGKLMIKNVFSKELKEGDMIDVNFVQGKNILGFSNTAIQSNIIPDDINLIDDLIAVDWSFFTILLSHGNKAYFTNRFQTYYRQYDKNLAGLKSLNKEKLLRGLDVKNAHLDCLKKNSIKTIAPSEQYVNLKKRLQADKLELENYLKHATKIVEKGVLLWEHIKLI